MSEPAILITANGEHPLCLCIADRFGARFRGLMLSTPLPADHGLLITRCSSVHSMLMRYALDLVYLDQRGTVLRCVKSLKPWRASWGPRGAAHTLELAAGSIGRLGISVGDRLQHQRISTGR